MNVKVNNKKIIPEKGVQVLIADVSINNYNHFLIL